MSDPMVVRELDQHQRVLDSHEARLQKIECALAKSRLLLGLFTAACAALGSLIVQFVVSLVSK